jgi:hypothetical protein
MRSYSRTIFLILVVFLTCCTQSAKDSAGNNARQTSTVEQGDRGQMLQPNTPVEARVAGPYLKAFLVSYESFNNDPQIPEAKRPLENYDFEFRQGKTSYFIWFIPRSAHSGPIVGGDTELGRAVTYSVSKADFRITGKQFYK